MLTPIEERPGHTPQHTRLVHESHWPEQGGVLTIVASLSRMSHEDPELVTEWRAYWMAFGTLHSGAWDDERIELCARTGTKVPEEIARAMFPRLEGAYYAP